MISVTYNSTTTCKIDGWLKSTIDKSESLDKVTTPHEPDKKYIRNDNTKRDGSMKLK